MTVYDLVRYANYIQHFRYATFSHFLSTPIEYSRYYKAYIIKKRR